MFIYPANIVPLSGNTLKPQQWCTVVRTRTKDRHRERSSHPCNLNLSEALYNKVLGITNNTPSHSNRKIYGNLPVFGQSQLPCPFIISRFHCITITVLSFSYFQPP